MTSFRPYLVNALVEWLLDNDQIPLIRINASVDGVEVPQQHIDESGHINLNVSPDAVRNFRLDGEGLQFDTRFSGVSHRIKAPVDAIVGINGRGGSVGFAFGPEIDEMSAQIRDATGDKPQPKKKPQLTLVKE